MDSGIEYWKHNLRLRGKNMPTNNSWNSQDPVQVAKGGTGVSTLTSHGVLLGNASSNINATGEPANGQLLIGKTGDFPQLGTLTAGPGISITEGAGSITTSSSGGWILIQSQSANSSATIDFTGLSTYRNIVIVIDGLRPVTNTASLLSRVSQDNGSTYLVSGYFGSVSYNAYNSTTLRNSNSTANFPLTGPMDSGFVSGAGMIRIYNMNFGNYVTMTGETTWLDTTLITTTIGSVGGMGPTGINAISFAFSSGNIAVGDFTLFGIKTS
jgi:hypothetical protein